MGKYTENVFEPLDDYEKDLMDSIERDEWKSVGNLEERKDFLKKSANLTLARKKRVNFRMTEADNYLIKIRAIQEGIPYQTLINSIIHKYLNGTLINR